MRPKERPRCHLTPSLHRAKPRLANFKIRRNRLFSFVRADWTLFRTVEGLCQKAGIPRELLRSLVLKERADNALDTDTAVQVGETDDGHFFVEDAGPGIDGTPEDIAHLYSISRPLVSTKLLRKPLRGALGNGLRVVASAVLVSQGSLVITTGNRRIVLRPEVDGTTTVVNSKAVKFPHGTRVEIGFGRALPDDGDTLYWARWACQFAKGKIYSGLSSPFWYDVPHFLELFRNAPARKNVREVVARLDGCTGKAGELVAEAGLIRTKCRSITTEQAKKLLLSTRAATDQVSASRLGAIGPDGVLRNSSYAIEHGVAEFGADEPFAQIPFTIEAWAALDKTTSLLGCLNRTPIAGDFNASRRDKTDIDFYGCGLYHTVAKAKADEHFSIVLNVVTPFMPYTSDGKEPDLKPFLSKITAAVSKAVKKARKPPPPPEPSLLPKKRRGRRSQVQEDIYRHELKVFCDKILQIRSTMDFAVGSRGWCYILERHGLRKGDFDDAEKLITDCRKSGDLPLDICAEDASRDAIGVEEIDTLDVSAKADALLDFLIKHGHEGYLPISLWDDLDVYVEVVTEKLDLRNLFEPVCRELHVPITNFKGWSDINARAAIMRRFAYWYARGKKCVLLVCGDHDPGGLHITTKLRKNLDDLTGAMEKNFGIDWKVVGNEENLRIIRFGLNADFIDDNNLTWIDNLETSSGKQLDDEEHADYYKDYVQDYLAEFGVKKCEANALVVEPVIGRQLCRDAILEHVPLAAVQRYERRLARSRKDLKAALAERIG
jgi:hypothetical protein